MKDFEFTFEATPTPSYYLLITALSSAYETELVHRLVNENYVVSSLSNTISTKYENSIGVVIALNVSKKTSTMDDYYDINRVYKEVVQITNDLKMCYFSMVITHESPLIWVGSNIVSEGEIKLSNVKKDLVN